MVLLGILLNIIAESLSVAFQDIKLKYQYLTISLILLAEIICVELVGSWGDVNNYWVNINDVIVDLKVPYSETTFEYPPLALIILLVPRLFSWDLDSFRIIYAFWTSLMYILSMHYSYKLGKKMNISSKYVFFIYLVMVFSMNQLIMTRYDIFPILLILIALDKYLDNHVGFAFVIISVATMVKLYPALIAVALLYPYFAKKDFISIVKYVCLCVVICLLVEMPFLLYDCGSAFNWLTYHSDRGIQVESVFATFIELYAYLDPSCAHVVFNYGSSNLVGSLPDLIAPYMNLVLLCALFVFIIWLAYCALSRPFDEGQTAAHIVSISVLLVFVFIIFNKVFSAQYALWYLSLILFPISYHTIQSRKRLFVCILTCGFFSCITFFVYGMSSGFDMVIDPPLQLIKNVLVICLFILILKEYCHYLKGLKKHILQ